MSNAIDLSRRQQLLAKAKRDLHALENVQLAGEVEGVKAMRILIGSYPQTPPADPEMYMRQVSTLLAHAPLDVVHALVDPRSGILTQIAFLPSIAEIHAWLDVHQRGTMMRRRQLCSQIETLAYDDGPTPPPAHVREKQIAEARELLGKRRDERKAELDAKMDARFRKTQRHSPELSMQALKNLDKMVPGSKD